MEFLANLGLFAAKTALVAAAAIVVTGFIFMLFNRNRTRTGQLEVEKLNERYDGMALTLKSEALPKKAFKTALKNDKKNRKSAPSRARRSFVIDFDGDMRAIAAQSLREEITAILSLQPTAQDEVVLRLESPGGLVNAYGFAAAQLERLRKHKIPLVACVDKVAASGGYMMACVADRILAAPFAVVGSIGVVAGVPNVHRLLEKYDIDYREVTAGQYKRTVSILGEITPQGLEKFRGQINDTHELFKAHVAKWRPSVNLEQVATGEFWYGSEALGLSLVDEIMTSDEYLAGRRAEADVFRVRYNGRKSLSDKLAENIVSIIAQCAERVWALAKSAEKGS